MSSIIENYETKMLERCLNEDALLIMNRIIACLMRLTNGARRSLQTPSSSRESLAKSLQQRPYKPVEDRCWALRFRLCLRFTESLSCKQWHSNVTKSFSCRRSRRYSNGLAHLKLFHKMNESASPSAPPQLSCLQLKSMIKKVLHPLEIRF